MRPAINCSSSEVGRNILGFNLVVPKCDRFWWNIPADHSVSPNDGVMANGDIAHDYCASIDGDVVVQRWIFTGLCSTLAPPPDRDILIDRDATSDLHLTADNNTDRMRKVYCFQVARWNLTTNERLQEGPQGCQSRFQEDMISFRMALLA